MPDPKVRQLSALRVSEARLLALMLRTSRLTWLFAANGTDKSELLTQGVLPLLQRRQCDRMASPASLPRARAAHDVLDRRVAADSQGRKHETVVYFERWSDAPLMALKTTLIQALPAKARSGLGADTRLARLIGDIESGFDLKLVFVLNNFERFFGKSTSPDARSAFADEWCEAVSKPGLAAGFLMSLDESCRPRLELFRQRVPGLDHNALRLLTEPTTATASTPALKTSRAPRAAPTEAARMAVSPATPSADGCRNSAARSARLAQRASTPPPTPIKVDEVYAFIESTLAKTAVQGPTRHWPSATAPAETGVPALSLNFDDEAYISPTPRMGGAEAYGSSVDAERNDSGTQNDAGRSAKPRSTGRRLISAFRRLGAGSKS